MRHFYTLFLLLLALAGNVHAQGWPKDYKVSIQYLPTFTLTNNPYMSGSI